MKNKALAWSVHILTSTGVLCALFATVDIMEGRAGFALLWLLLAQVIDGVDGPLARRFEVKKHVPVIDGTTMDLVIDYMTCAVIPVLFALKFHIWPEQGELVLASLVLISSILWFSRTDIETKDIWFRGFPTSWNMAITILWILQTSITTNVIFTVLLIILTMTPRVKFFHILSSPQMRSVTVPFSGLTMVLMAWMVHGHHFDNTYARATILLWVAYSAGMTLWRTLQPDEIKT